MTTLTFSNTLEQHPHKKITIGVSSCLLGFKVRYNGDHKRDHYISDILGNYVEYLALCPEAESGLGIPREPIHLVVNTMGKRQAIGTKNKQLNVTEPLLRFSKNTAKHLIPISGYIFKSSSPSCGIRDIPTFDSAGCIVESGPGLFAEEIMHTWPRLPVIDEVQLQNSKMRDNFIERVYAYQRWRELCTPGVTPPKLEKFHQQQRSVLLSHGANGLKTLDLVIEKLHKERPSLARILNEYERDFMQILKRQTTRQQHCRVLVHLLNKIKNNISIEECNRTFELIMDYRTGYSPWSAPVEAMKNLLSHTPYAELTKQIYLNPDPVEMILRGLNSTSRKPVGLSEQRIY